MILKKVARALFAKSARRDRHAYREVLTPLQAQHLNGKVLFPVEIKSCSNRAGIPFNIETKHPITSTAVILLRSGRTEAVRHLKAWYLENVYGDWGAVFGIVRHTSGCQMCMSAVMSHVPRERFRLPWETTGYISHKTPLYGPVDEGVPEHEVGRLEFLLESIVRNGFDTGLQSNPIRGYLLNRGDEVRFVVKGGQHRIAALAALGYDRAPVTWQPDWTRVVDAKHSARWPHVEAGYVCQGVAAKVFHSFFVRERLTLPQASSET